MGSSSSSTSLPANRMRASSTRRRSPPESDAQREVDAVRGQAEAGDDAAASARPRSRRRCGSAPRPVEKRSMLALGRVLLERQAQLLEPVGGLVEPATREHVAEGGGRPSSPRRSGGPAGGSRARRCAAPMPAGRVVLAASTFSRLVLPAPLRPTRPTLSPGATVKLASDSTRRPPTSTLRRAGYEHGRPGWQRCLAVTTAISLGFVATSRPPTRLWRRAAAAVVAAGYVALADPGRAGRLPTYPVPDPRRHRLVVPGLRHDPGRPRRAHRARGQRVRDEPAAGRWWSASSDGCGRRGCGQGGCSRRPARRRGCGWG